MVISDELYHHGIKGQKWGVRRFQNKDGSLTDEGYRHWGLNPDGSKMKTHGYSEHTKSASRKGSAVGVALGIAAGVATGGVTAVPTLAAMGILSGGMAGTAVGAINTHRTRKKIQRLLDDKGKVYVKDL